VKPLLVLKDNSLTDQKKHQKGIFHTLLFPMFKMLYNAHTLLQFDSLAKAIIVMMKQKGESAFAEWFSKVYLVSHWRLCKYNDRLREIRRYQWSTEPLIPLAPFPRLIRHVLFETRGKYDDDRLASIVVNIILIIHFSIY
jgi:hypothetical protein